MSTKKEKKGKGKGVTDGGEGPPQEIQQAIRRLSEMVDLAYFMGYIGRKSAYGKKPHAEPWGYTRQMLRERDGPVSLEEIVEAFENLGIHDEIKAAEWVVLNDKHIP